MSEAVDVGLGVVRSQVGHLLAAQTTTRILFGEATSKLGMREPGLYSAAAAAAVAAAAAAAAVGLGNMDVHGEQRAYLPHPWLMRIIVIIMIITGVGSQRD